MTRYASRLGLTGLTAAVLAVGVTVPGLASDVPTAGESPSTVVMGFPESLGAMQRPPVEFNHAAHTEELKSEGCTTCHLVEEASLNPAFKSVVNVADRKGLIDAYHDACIGCHQSRISSSLKAGPVVCGDCHARREGAASQWEAMHWDYSIHARHDQIYPEKCGTCHHVYNEAEKKLEYKKGAEDSCHSCHGARDEGKNLSLTNASHTSCVGCHLQRSQAGQKGGPIHCVGCHDAQVLRTYQPLDPVPRLVRGQPDRGWIGAEDTRAGMVPFDHLGHEPQASFCSGCHHPNLDACVKCHTLTGAPEGDLITLEESYHRESSGYSCVGCHLARATATECVGCHRSIPTTPSQRSCALCHSGPSRVEAGPDYPPPTARATPALPPLPASPDKLPEQVVIKVLAKDYEPAQMPHRKIVEKLDEGIRKSRLATSFHGSTERLCAGCHHHSQEGTMEPRCRACHGETAAPAVDRPDLKVAYHRQCIGCHQAMGIKKQGCTDCHAAKEVPS
jgi:hypothetical protein